MIRTVRPIPKRKPYTLTVRVYLTAAEARPLIEMARRTKGATLRPESRSRSAK